MTLKIIYIVPKVSDHVNTKLHKLQNIAARFNFQTVQILQTKVLPHGKRLFFCTNFAKNCNKTNFVAEPGWVKSHSYSWKRVRQKLIFTAASVVQIYW